MNEKKWRKKASLVEKKNRGEKKYISKSKLRRDREKVGKRIGRRKGNGRKEKSNELDGGDKIKKWGEKNWRILGR